MKQNSNLGAYIAAFVAMFLVWSVMTPDSGSSSLDRNISYSTFLDRVEDGRITSVYIEGTSILATTSDGASLMTNSPFYDDKLVEKLRENNVDIRVAPSNSGGLFSILLGWIPILLLIGVYIYMMRQFQGKGGGAMGFGKSKAKLLNQDLNKITFDDVAGIDEAKQELEEIVEFLRNPSKFTDLGGTVPRGVLLVGSPGTGKTLTAKAVAGEAGVPFFSISGSDFVEMFVGVGAARVRDMFEQAKKNAPCIVFIDEIDAVGRHRGAGLGGGNDEREQTLNQLLVEMDGFQANDGIIIVAATNRPDVLDPALLRPGRFDRQVVVPLPDVIGREQILKVHMRKVRASADVDPRIIARGTPGFSGADLANLVNEAALMAARRNKRNVSMQDFEDAKDKVMMGAERKSMVMTLEEKKLTAYHEAGHAICALKSPASDPVHKATIIPRGRALGMVMRLPEKDRVSMTVAKLKSDLIVAMGGRVAEEMFFGAENVTTGASSDIQMATNIAKRMVTEWGMSEKLGTIRYVENNEEVFLGRSISRTQNMSDSTAQLIDDEVKRIVNEALEESKRICTVYKDELETIANGLLEYETLSGEEINDLLEGKDLDRSSTGVTRSRSSIVSSLPKVGKKPSLEPNPGTSV